MEGHHLILGKVRDYLTGEELTETHDEQYRQGLARLLVSAKGFAKSQVTPRYQLEIQVGEQRAIIPVDFLVRVDARISMLIKYGPGSLVTRERSALAASRLVAPYQIPWVVVTNGEDAHILEGANGKLMATGINGIPDIKQLRHSALSNPSSSIDPRRAVMESRILYAYEVDDACPCDTTVCRITRR
ncbi:MAG: type I restriction enzyme HsdR N-terminal domain-containing protein [Desulfobacterales bacterium]